MQRYITDLQDSEFTDLLESSGRVFRLETMQTYRVPGEADEWAAWRRNDADAPARAMARWCGGPLAAAAAEGRVMQRLHVVHLPMTNYMRFQMECYRHAVAAGEQVKLLTCAPGRWPHGLPRQDFWLFGDHTAAEMEFDAQGRFLSMRMTDQAVVVERALRAYRTAWDHPQGRLLNALPVPYRA